MRLTNKAYAWKSVDPSLALAFAVQAGLVLARTINLYSTGFLTSDEADYALRSILGLPYGDRYFFDYVTLGLFRLFHIDTVTGFYALFPFYVAFWSFCYLILAYKIASLLTTNRQARSFVVLTLPFLVTYSLLSVGFLTETPGLVLATLGVYLTLRYLKARKDWYLPPLASLALVAAAFTREPYVAIAVIAVPIWLLIGATSKGKRVHPILFIIPLVILLVVPGSPLTILTTGATPVVLPPNQSTTVVTTVVALTNTTTAASTTTTTATAISTTATTNSQSSSTITSSSSSSTSSTQTTTGTTATGSTAVSETTIQTTVTYTPGTSLVTTLSNAVYLFFAGLALGWDPILFAVGVAGFALLLLRMRRGMNDKFLVLIILAVLASFFGVAVQYAYFVHYFSANGISALIRYANPSTTAYILLAPVVYDRMSKRGFKILALLLVVMAVLSFGAYSEVTQSQLALNYNALSLGHPYGPFLARQYFLSHPASQPTLVYISWDWKAGQLYLLGLQNLTVYPTFQNFYVSEQQFVSARPANFYILSAGPLGRTANDSLGQLGLPSPPAFLTYTLYSLYHIPQPNTAPYSFTNVDVIFNGTTGYLLAVNTSWST